MNRALYAIPALTMLAVAYVLFVLGSERPLRAVRVYGGPHDPSRAHGSSERPAHPLSLRVLASERLGTVERPWPTRLTVHLPTGQSWAGTTNARGIADVQLPAAATPPPAPAHVRVESPDSAAPLAEGQLDAPYERWWSRARIQGGFLRGTTQGALRLRVAPGRGLFAIPFTDPLAVQVTDQHGQPVRARVRAEHDGSAVHLITPEAHTDADGWAQLRVTVHEPVATLRLLADATRNTDDASGSWYGNLPVLPGALHATREGDVLHLTSPVPRDAAYFALIDRHGKLAGGSVALQPSPQGLSHARVPLPRIPDTSATWAVVSSEPDLVSPAALGWPLSTTRHRHAAPPLPHLPPSTGPWAYAITVPELLLLDGFPQAEAREAERRRRARHLATAISLTALVSTAWLVLRSARLAQRRLAAHLERGGLDRDQARAIERAPSRLELALIALLCITLGFSVLGFIAYFRLS